MEQQLEKLAKLPLAHKLGGLVVFAALVTALNYYLVVMDLDAQIEAQTVTRETRERELAEKTALANNLNMHLQEMEELEMQLAAALTELPEQKQLDELLKDLQDIGRKVGLVIESVTPGAEQRDGAVASFVARIPIRMQLEGNFHEIALFFQELGGLRRIVNVADIKLGSPLVRSEKVVLKTDFVATAFRFVPQQTAQGKKAR